MKNKISGQKNLKEITYLLVYHLFWAFLFKQRPPFLTKSNTAGIQTKCRVSL